MFSKKALFLYLQTQEVLNATWSVLRWCGMRWINMLTLQEERSALFWHHLLATLQRSQICLFPSFHFHSRSHFCLLFANQDINVTAECRVLSGYIYILKYICIGNLGKYIQNPYLITKLRFVFSCTCFGTNNFSVAISTCYLSDPDPSPHCTLSIIFQSTCSQHSNITFGICLHLLSISGVKT